MGKSTGFLEFGRVEPESRLPTERVKDFGEFVGTLPEAALSQQAARCMDCGIPFCQSGQMIRGATAGCPLHNLIPEWNDLVYRGRWREALDRLHSTNDFPEFTGRVCPAPCESSCVLSVGSNPVTIKSIECSIVDRGFAEGWIVPRPPEHRTGKTVAIIGSGPAGLACASQLNARGHTVTVYERSPRIGGLLVYGVPAMKLDKGSVQRRVDLLAAEGVRFVTGVTVGADVPASRLRADHDAVVVAIGASKPRPLGVPGENLGGVVWAMDYLTEAVRAGLERATVVDPPLDARGRRVVVIGGGDTGTDCVATALRQGAASVVQLQHNPQPPDLRPSNNPWPQWPKVHRIEYGHEEAHALQGADPRTFETRTLELVGDGAAVTAVSTVEIGWTYDDAGGRSAIEIPGTRAQIPVDMVLLAMGFIGPEPLLPRELSLNLDSRGLIVSGGDDASTPLPGVFVAGDCRRGQSLVVWAIHEGRRAALACHGWLTEGR